MGSVNCRLNGGDLWVSSTADRSEEMGSWWVQARAQQSDVSKGREEVATCWDCPVCLQGRIQRITFTLVGSVTGVNVGLLLPIKLRSQRLVTKWQEALSAQSTTTLKGEEGGHPWRATGWFPFSPYAGEEGSRRPLGEPHVHSWELLGCQT